MKKSIVSLAALLLAAPVLVQAQIVVVPNANTITTGNIDNRFPFLVTGGMRYQQVYASSQFSALTGPSLITQIALRPSSFVHEAFTTTLPDIQIDFSTVSLAPDALSSTFASNVGADDTIVYARGALTLSSSNTPGLFDTVITLSNPFLYNPAAGNVLMDVRNFGGAPSHVGTEFFDAQKTTGDPVSRVFGAEGSPNNTSGAPDSLGLITQFKFGAAVPEPGSVALLIGLGTTGATFLLRRRRK